MIEVSNLVKVYGTNVALDGISFAAGEREVLGFLGPNGAGKSTAMNIMTGFLSYNSGTVKVGGVDISEKPDEAKKLIGFLPEQPPLYQDMTVREYLNFVYDLKDCKFNREKHIEEICKVTRITDVRKRLIKNLSKGYRQRVGIAQALIGNPKVLIFDEPTVGLDPKQIIEVRNLIRTLGREHTVILSTHILSEVQAVADRIIIINEGKLLADEKTENINRAINENVRYMVKICGPQREVLDAIRAVDGVLHAEISSEREKDSFTYHVESEHSFDMRKNLFFAMAEKNWPIVAMEQEGVSLEDVFIKLTDSKSLAQNTRRGGRR
ncbi:MAG: ATP-binding cassette domain-containing protein [Ruminococcaceae bacterium]|nr:ATP-binding cassette domain-containing protein [Oscillospiraceae bacterium]